MAFDLKLKIKTSDDCKNLVIQDVTGAYNSLNNTTGWGGFNIDGNRQKFNISCSIIVNHFISGTQYSSVIGIENFANSVNIPLSEDTFRGFKLSIPAYDISTAIANLESIPDEYEPIQEVLADTLYEIYFTITSSRVKVPYSEVFKFEFRNICSSEKIVNKLLGTVNLGCEDCDDSDIEKALLAKSLLETLKKIK